MTLSCSTLTAKLADQMRPPHGPLSCSTLSSAATPAHASFQPVSPLAISLRASKPHCRAWRSCHTCTASEAYQRNGNALRRPTRHRHSACCSRPLFGYSSTRTVSFRFCFLKPIYVESSRSSAFHRDHIITSTRVAGPVRASFASR